MTHSRLPWIGFLLFALICLGGGRIALRETALLSRVLFAIGAGMSGMMCAYFAATAERDVPPAFHTMFIVVAAIAILSLIAGWIAHHRQNRS